ncbi:MAG: virulence factor BrkB family protein, partial [Haemophilus parahaemolyticus]|nr:virulence factor BrkB family protein [Haemophilus parahaemolyticus]
MKPYIRLFFRVFFKRIGQNQIPVTAGYLTYNTMLATVPLIMVIFSVFTIFPFFEEATGQIKALIYDNFAPSAG